MQPGGDPDPSFRGTGALPLDFFTVDFNEDFSAFHGVTLLEQAEYANDAVRYILSLYTQSPRTGAFGRPLPDPGAVLIIGHSMGGIVARKMLDMFNYQIGSVNTILSISTPHAVPPVTLDRRIETVYKAVDRLWAGAFSRSADSRPRAAPIRPDNFGAGVVDTNPLADVLLISLSGGTSDTTISPSDSSLLSVVPPSHGLTAFTTSVPGVWSPIDHLAILWCDQLRRVLARVLLDVSDSRVASQVRPLPERLEIFKRALLTGLEDDDRRRDIGGRVFVTFRRQSTVLHKLGSRLVLGSIDLDREGTFAHILPIPPLATYSPSLVLSLLTDARIGAGVQTLACKGQIPDFGAADQPMRRSCDSLAPSFVSRLPRSVFRPKAGADPGAEDDPYAPSMDYLEAKVQQLDDYGFLAVTTSRSDASFVIGEFSDADSRSHVVHGSLFKMLFTGLRTDVFPSRQKRSLVTELEVPAISTSLLAFKARVFREGACDIKGLFAPLMRQHTPGIGESKFHPDVRAATLFTHAVAPFSPPSPSSGSQGLGLQFWTDPTSCGASEDEAGGGEGGDLALEIRLDAYHSLAKIVLRYRMAIVAFPLATIGWVVRCQLREYGSSGRFGPFGPTLSATSRKGLGRLMILAMAMSLAQSILLATQFSSDRTKRVGGGGGGPDEWRGATRSHWAVADLLLGERNPFFFALAALLFAVGVGLVAAVCVVWQAALSGITWAWMTAQARGPPSVQRYLRCVGTPLWFGAFSAS